MDFLYLFDMVNFDGNGMVCDGKSGLGQARSNFLYLVSKYNQTILQEEGLPIPDFFKTELGDVLACVENGGDFEKAKEKVLANCHLKVQHLALGVGSDREFVSALNQTISARDEAFAKLVGRNINHLELAYIITSLSGKVEKKIEQSLLEDLSQKSEKSKVFKEMIKYNRLMLTAQKVSVGELSVKDLCPVVA